MRVVFVHGACVKDGSWWWHRTAELLAERDVASEAPALTELRRDGLSRPVRKDRRHGAVWALTARDEPPVLSPTATAGIADVERGRCRRRAPWLLVSGGAVSRRSG